MNEPVKLYRYLLPPEPYGPRRGEGWAEIVVGSNGFFAAVSDYENYAFRWRSFGPGDFRQFLLGVDWHYAARKLGTREQLDVYDGYATLRNAKSAIIELRREHARIPAGPRVHGGWSREIARKEWQLLMDSNVDDGLENFHQWCSRTEVGDAWELGRTRLDASLEAFCKHTLARMRVLIIDELARETLRPAAHAWFQKTAIRNWAAGDAW